MTVTMHFSMFGSRAKQDRGKSHHNLYILSFNIYEQASTRTEVFYAVQGKRIDKKDKTRVDSLVNMLQRCHRGLVQNVSLARELLTKQEIGQRDLKCMVRFEKQVKKWLSNILDLQLKLERQLDAEKYFQLQETCRKTKRADTPRHTAYLQTKPLPPLRKSVVNFTTGTKSRVTIMPAEKDAEVFRMLEDEDLNPIIDSYRRSRIAFELDGLQKTPIDNVNWI